MANCIIPTNFGGKWIYAHNHIEKMVVNNYKKKGLNSKFVSKVTEQRFSPSWDPLLWKHSFQAGKIYVTSTEHVSMSVSSKWKCTSVWQRLIPHTDPYTAY